MGKKKGQKKVFNDGLMSMEEAAQYARISRQAMAMAIRSKRIQGHKKGYFWRFSKEQVDQYRESKYNREYSKINGEPIFSIENGVYSVNHVARILSHVLKVNFDKIKRWLYIRVRTGDLPAYKKGAAWVILREDAEELLRKRLEESGDANQYSLKFG